MRPASANKIPGKFTTGSITTAKSRIKDASFPLNGPPRKKSSFTKEGLSASAREIVSPKVVTSNPYKVTSSDGLKNASFQNLEITKAFKSKPHASSRQSLLTNMQQHSLTHLPSPKSVELKSATMRTRHESKKAFIPNHTRQSSLGRLQKMHQTHIQKTNQTESQRFCPRKSSKHGNMRNSSLI